MKSRIVCFLLTSAFIGGLALLSCANTPKEKKTPGQAIYEKVIEQVEERVLSDKWLEDRITKKWYEGHEYLIYGEGYRGSIVHNPNCPCNKTE